MNARGYDTLWRGRSLLALWVLVVVVVLVFTTLGPTTRSGAHPVSLVPDGEALSLPAMPPTMSADMAFYTAQAEALRALARETTSTNGGGMMNGAPAGSHPGAAHLRLTDARVR